MARGEINATLNCGSVVDFDLLSKTHFGLRKQGQAAAPQIAPCSFIAPLPIDIARIRDEFNRCLNGLIYKYGTMVIEIEGFRVRRVIARASVRRDEPDTLGSFFLCDHNRDVD
ncbi:MAG: hypothetical protein ACREHD_08155 [Pirellulales bacterium]